MGLATKEIATRLAADQDDVEHTLVLSISCLHPELIMRCVTGAEARHGPGECASYAESSACDANHFVLLK